MSKVILTIEITDQELKVLWLTGKTHLNRIPQGAIIKFDLISIPTGVIDQGILQDEEIFIAQLQAYFAQMKIVEPILFSLLIPFQLGFVRTYRLPWIAKTDRKSAIGFLIDEEVPIPGTDLLSDFIILEENQGSNQLNILVGATRRSLIKAYVEAFRQVGFQVNNIDFAISALGYALGLEKNEESLYLSAKDGTLELILYSGIIPEVVRTLLPNPSLTAPDAEWESEIQRTLLYYRNQHSELSLKKIYTDGERAAELIAGRLQKAGFVSRVLKADLVRMPDAWKKRYLEWPDEAKAVMGNVLRILHKAPGINLWRQRGGSKKNLIISKGILCTSVLGLFAGLLVWFPLQNQENRLRNEIEQIQSQGRDILAFSNHQKELQSAWQKAREHQLYVGEGLAEIHHLLPSGVALSHLEYNEGELNIEGITDTAEHFEEFLKALKSAGLENPLLTTYQYLNQVSIKFAVKTGYLRLR